MRFNLVINISERPIQTYYSFKNSSLTEILTEINEFKIQNNICLSLAKYKRDKPGLIEFNWEKPFYDNQTHFLFIAGYVQYRNKLNKTNIPSPAEVLQIILTHGDDHFQHLKGNYYILIYNKLNKSISIYASPMFMHPSFYSVKSGCLIFTNYVNSFKNFFSPSINENGLVDFALIDHCLGDTTLYKDIYSIEGGKKITIDENGIKISVFYDHINWFHKKPILRDKALPLINDSLKKSINEWISCTEKFNISVTGGFDGRLNLSFINPNLYNKLVARSYGMPGSLQIKIPENISKKIGFKYEPVYLDNKFEDEFPNLGLKSIDYTCGITGFNRAMYPYAYDIYAKYSRSALLGQCDMIRPLFTNPAGIVFNEISQSIFFNDYNTYKKNFKKLRKKLLFNEDYFTIDQSDRVYEFITNNYIDNYKELDKPLQYYFFLIKESLMKYWQTEFHLVDLYIDDYVSFADLDYLELLFSSEYAGIYKGLMAKSQLKRKSPHDLYVDLMQLNNDKLNYFKNDRYIKPGWLKYGKLGWVYSGIIKKTNNLTRSKKNDTFNSDKWANLFYNSQLNNIESSSQYFNSKKIINSIGAENQNLSSQDKYRLNRAISTKIWLSSFL